jgi:hypothetical protein
VVHGRIADVKTEYSRDTVPLERAVVEKPVAAIGS